MIKSISLRTTTIKIVFWLIFGYGIFNVSYAQTMSTHGVTEFRTEYGLKNVKVKWYRVLEDPIEDKSNPDKEEIGILFDTNIPSLSISKIWFDTPFKYGEGLTHTFLPFRKYIYFDAATAQSSNSEDYMGFSSLELGLRVFLMYVLFIETNIGVFDFFVCNNTVAENSDDRCVEVDYTPQFDYGFGVYIGKLYEWGFEYGYKSFTNDLGVIYSKDKKYVFEVIEHKLSLVLYF